MSQKKTIYVRKTADKDLKKILLYSIHHWGENRAERYIREIAESFQKLAENPSIGMNYSHIRPDIYAYRVVSHLIFYKPKKNGISIFRILHQSMDFKRHL